MYKDEFEELLENPGDLYHLFTQHRQYQISLLVAIKVLEQYPEGVNAFRRALLKFREAADGELAELLQWTIDDLDNGMFDPAVLALEG